MSEMNFSESAVEMMASASEYEERQAILAEANKPRARVPQDFCRPSNRYARWVSDGGGCVCRED